MSNLSTETFCPSKITMLISPNNKRSRNAGTGKIAGLRITLPNVPDVLREWQGMGYNRRAISLKKLAEIVIRDYKGRLPVDPDQLVKLPGIGKYSASAIYTFTTNKPDCLIETNIRRVYIHFFFGDREGIRDDEIMPLVEKTMDSKNPRDWYYALMDYGVKLKREVANPNRRSAHYAKSLSLKAPAARSAA